jgi:CRP/FNR family transcriptional regulator, cyclic AMP receptor protein
MYDPQLDVLRRISFFRELSDEVFAELSQQCHRKKYGAGERIIGHLDQSFDVLFLLTGNARVNLYSSAGHRVSFREIEQGAIFGELSALDGQARSASVEAVNSCSVTIMPRNLFTQALREHPEFMNAVMVHLTQQVRKLTGRVFEFSTLAVRNRIHAELVRLAEPIADSNQANLWIPPTHEEIASRISTHREAVSRELSRLDEMGLVVKRGRALFITDLRELRRLVEVGG